MSNGNLRILSWMLVMALCIGLDAGAATGSEGKAAGTAKQTVGSTSEVSVAYSKMGYALSKPAVSGNSIVLDVLTADGKATMVSMPLKQLEIDLLTTKDSGEAVTEGSFLEICYDRNGKVIKFNSLFKLTPAGCWFDTKKYGAEFSPRGNEPGNLIAAGWILDKSANRVVIGDTNRFEESYALADGVKVYELNAGTKSIVASSLSNLPVTQKTSGKYSLTPKRQMAVLVFDKNYRNADSARVAEIYYVTPQTVVPAKYLLEEYDTMSQFSYFPDTKTEGVIDKPYTMPWIGYTKPFTIVKDRMYFVGDNDVACYLFKTDSGLAMLDFGWTGCGYLYYQSIENLGFDPREIKYLLMSHGHLDHYGTVVEFNKMIRNAGGDPLVAQTYEDAKGYDIYGFPNIGATTPDLAVNVATDKFYTWEKWMDFGGVRVYPILTPGHTNGTGSFIFEVTPKGQKPITFGYMGGFGTIHTPDQGYRRAQFVYFLKYLQQNVNVDYSLPQHLAHFPMLELNKAAEKAGISFLASMVKSNDEWVNFLERRLVAQEMEMYRVKLEKDPKVQVKFPNGTIKEFTTQTAAPKLVRNEVGGPWKRKGGEYKITLADGGKVMHGFNILQNSNPLLNGIRNANGDNLGDGVLITRDGYMHDPDKWFLQISAHVDDAYDGKFSNLEGALNGPVESLCGEGWSEILRTVYFDSKADAESVLATLKSGSSYMVTLDRNSDIQLDGNPKNAFREVAKP